MLGLTVALPLASAGAAGATLERTEVFFSAGCADCWPYAERVLLPALREQGLAGRARLHDYTRPDERRRLLALADEVGLPRAIADSLYAFVPTGRGVLVLLGHVPRRIVADALRAPRRPERLAVWQPRMHGEPTEYRLWAWRGAVTRFPIETPFGQALERALASAGPTPAGAATPIALLPMVVTTGLLDSVNPCAVAVILLLVAFLFTLRKSRGRVLFLGSVFIAMVFVVYLGIGLGLLGAVRLSEQPHLVARAGAWLLVALGLVNVAEHYFPRFPVKLHMPATAHARARSLIRAASLPASAAAGVVVGLCTFPCSGGIYVSVIALLNARTTFAWGVGYMVLYNVLFVVPLLAILVAAGNRATAKAWARWEREHASRLRLGFGGAMVGLGTLMLTLVVG